LTGRSNPCNHRRRTRLSPPMPLVYIETSVISYLTARPASVGLVSVQQAITQRWWRERSTAFSLFCSQLVVNEARRGDPTAAALRLSMLDAVAHLEATPEAKQIAHAILDAGLVPPKAPEDAFHIAIATAHGMDYLLTWNCRHIANVEIRRGLSACCAELGYDPPDICTPAELMGW
jgi:hypothetical protein